MKMFWVVWWLSATCFTRDKEANRMADIELNGKLILSSRRVAAGWVRLRVSGFFSGVPSLRIFG
jgi:hypothetical protein